MQRRSFLKNTSLTIASLAMLNKESLAAFLADPAYNIKMLNSRVGVFTEKGGTILFLLGKKGIVVIDSQFPDTAQHCIDELKKKSDKPFALLVNTHHHGDHSSGNIAFKGIVAHVAAHANSKINQQNAAIKAKNEEKQLYPDEVYADIKEYKWGSDKVSLHYFGRGHTNGDSFVKVSKGNIVHVGDLVFNRRHPFVDRSAGASMKEWITTLEKGMAYFKPDTTYVCGHAGTGHNIVINKTDIQLFQRYLQNVLDLTENAIKSGITKEQYLKNTIMVPGSPEWKGDGLERPLGAAWDELKGL